MDPKTEDFTDDLSDEALDREEKNRLSYGSGVVATRSARSEANPATAHLWIANPLSAGGLRGLFSTHPPMEGASRLEAMAGQMPSQP